MEIKTLLKTVTQKGASDLIIVANSKPIIRLGGSLIPLGEETLDKAKAKELIYSMLTPHQIEIFERTKELDSSYELQGVCRFRVNVHFQEDSVAASLRTIPSEIPSAKSMMLPDIINEFIKEPRGMVLITGPTGSGKSTTQAVMIDIVNSTKSRHIITIEDPVEFMHKNKKSIIEQREIGQDTESFSAALTHVLRQNPDVILIGEMRDVETISIAITAAETGHLVISTLHTNDAVQTIDRIIDVFPPHQQNQIRTQLALTLRGVISQQLIPRSDGKGLVLAAEVLVINQAVSNIIRKGNTQEISSMIEIGSKYGMQTMDAALKNLYREGLISYENAMARAVNPENLEKLLAKA
ncbi:MAG: type IV pilus twitching motility protein PilT [Candidatus Saganbacteria bacterium]|nr:type IV pilus twitching motility protein PilT [Candidatus Saganbacteria bacterium]